MIVWLLGLLLMHGLLPGVSFLGTVQRVGYEAEEFVSKAGYACPAEQSGQIMRGERWLPGVGGLLADDLQDGGWAEI
jgi:hypothetical protein